eukprot:8521350-Heterocapsa_arctica.AAC.1
MHADALRRKRNLRKGALGHQAENVGGNGGAHDVKLGRGMSPEVRHLKPQPLLPFTPGGPLTRAS